MHAFGSRAPLRALAGALSVALVALAAVVPPVSADEPAPSDPAEARAFSAPGWLPFRGTRVIGCVTTNCSGGGHSDWAIDIPYVMNEPVYASGSGRVEVTVTDQGGNCDQHFFAFDECPDGKQGNAVLLDHGGGVYTFYGHLSTVLVHPGEMVTDGTVIGGAGNSGWTDPAFVHTHYEEWSGLVWSGGHRVEPRNLKGCKGASAVTYPAAAGGDEWNDLAGFRIQLRHDGGCNPNGPTCISGFIDVLGGHDFCSEITWMVGREITTGFGDGLFHPTRTTTRQGAVAWLYRLAGSPSGPFPNPGFSDVGPTHPFYDEIAWGVDAGIINGYADRTFRGTLPVSRQAFVAFLFRMAGAPEGPFPDPGFSDLAPTDPFFDEIAWGVDEGIVNGYADDRFRGGKDIARQAGAAFLERYAD